MNTNDLPLESFDISDYEFDKFDEVTLSDQAESYDFKNLDGLSLDENPEHQKAIKFERKTSNENNFLIAPIVREHRGLIKQEENEREIRVKDEVDRRLQSIEKQAFEKGYTEGVEIGKEEVFKQSRIATEEKLVSLTELIEEVLCFKAELLKSEKKQVYETVRNLAKWVILREIKDDDDYLNRLMEKLVLEMQTKTNLLVRVNKSDFDKMPEVLEFVQEKLGKMTNVRVEMDYDNTSGGIVLEAENGILNGTLSQQLLSVDNLFNNVGVESDEIYSDPELEPKEEAAVAPEAEAEAEPEAEATPEEESDEDDSKGEDDSES
ncbi:MAG: hypothetical protein HN509_11260 [Halobacteriovoraceae bacterium]|jgi:flagellar assembly protein FliH|nr:hypothetical protein [Halobacteriovoraceae bacterium]MBT5092788.1 hypothetical protein [Halobacteriovoraceae bacterium]